MIWSRYVYKLALWLTLVCSILFGSTMLIGQSIPEGWKIRYAQLSESDPFPRWTIYLHDVSRNLASPIFTEPLDVDFIDPATITVANIPEHRLFSLSPDNQWYFRYVPTSINTYLTYLINTTTRSTQAIEGFTNTNSAWSPDSSHFAYVVTNAQNVTRIVVARLNNGIVERVTITPEGLNAQNPTWSPDGTRIAFRARPDTSADPHHIYVMDRNGNNLRNLTASLSVNAFVAYWSSDGEHLAFTAGDSNYDVYSINLNSGDVLRVTSDFTYDSVVGWWLNRPTLVYTTVDQQGTVLVSVNIDDNRISEPMPLLHNITYVDPMLRPPNANQLMYMQVDRGRPTLYLFDFITRDSTRLITLPDWLLP